MILLVAALLVQAPDSVALAKIRAEGLGKTSQVMETLSWLTDVSGGRLTNSPSMKSAADWVTTRLAGWGISKQWRENWGPFGRGWTNEVAMIRAVTPQPFTIIANVEAWTPSTKGVVRGPAVLVTDIKADSDFAKYRGKLRGAFVMLAPVPAVEAPPLTPLATRLSAADLATRSRPFPAERALDSAQLVARAKSVATSRAAAQFRQVEIPKFLAAEGALAILGVSKGSGGVVFLSNDLQGSPDPAKAAPLPALTLTSEHYGRIARILEKKLPVILEADIRNTFVGGMDSSFNILAEIPGTDRASEVVMIGAHFDAFSYATGATDNGANVAVMMEAMRILKATGLPMRRTLRLGLWTGEEQGLFGSKAYVQRHFVDSVTMQRRAEFGTLAAYYNLDNGGGAIRGPMSDVNRQLTTETDSTFKVWMAALPGMGMDLVSPRGGGGTDHVSFFIRGLPGFQFMQDWLDYDTRTHHTNMDTYERVVPQDLQRNATIVAAFAYLTANRAEGMAGMKIGN